MAFRFTLLLLLFTTVAKTQIIAGFEHFNLPVESVLNGSDGNGGFLSNDVFLPNQYDSQWMSWSGWAISNTTDIATPGFTNQYSAIAGSGAEGSAHYAITYAFGNNNIVMTGNAVGKPLAGMFITNSTYAYLSMRDGDAFSKKFGGATGNDPDYFLLTIRAYFNGVLSDSSVDFYLADYRFTDNNQDYIINGWTWVDLSSLGIADSLAFSLTSSDTGQFGMNTPAYFCVDNLTITTSVATSTPGAASVLQLYPNPVAEVLKLVMEENTIGQPAFISIYTQGGQLMAKQVIKTIEKDLVEFNVGYYPSGTYIINVEVAGKARQTGYFVVPD